MHSGRLRTSLLTLLLLTPLPALPGRAAAAEPRLPIREVKLDSGMTFLLVPRQQTTTVSAGWVVRSGSADETEGRTGWSHLLEHMLFKGTRTIGTPDPEGEAAVLRQQDEVWEEMQRLEGRTGRRVERRLAELRTQFSRLEEQARGFAFLGELSFRYSAAGGVGLNASTLPDFAFYWVTLPAEKLELWYWLESDRLLHPVFRELYTEKSVIAEERRQRIESQPTGEIDVALRAELWRGTSYAWPPIGRPGDLDGIGRRDLEALFRQAYTPDRLTAVLVGDLDPERAEELARRYFGRLRSPARTRQENRWEPRLPGGITSQHSCDCPAQARVEYLTVPFGHPDSYALQLLAGLLNGRSGRLHRSLVLEREIAFAAGAGQYSSRRAGYFGFEAETRGEARPEALVAAWDEELARLIAEPIPETDIVRVKNQVTADAFRQLKEPEDLLKRLLVYAGLGSWQEVEELPRRILELTGQDVREAAIRHLRPERRRVALIYRGSPPEVP